MGLLTGKRPILVSSGEYISNKPLKRSDIFDENINFNGLIDDLYEICHDGRIEQVRQAKTTKCPNCGATKHKMICEYCGT